MKYKNKLSLKKNRDLTPDLIQNQMLPENLMEEDIAKLEDLEDGSSVYSIGKEEIEQSPDKFGDNLALKIKKDILKKISSYLLDCIEEDISARQPWLDIHNKVKKYLGHNIEDAQTPFAQACRTFDTTLDTALIRFCATTRPELLPESGPCGFKIFGQDDNQLKDIAKIRSQWLNYFLTVKDSGYYKDYEKFLYYLGFYGTVIRKVYYDSITNMPISRFVLPENFLVNIDCTSILDSDRLTHILKLSSREVLINQKNGTYREVELSYLKHFSKNSDDAESDKNKNINDIVNIDGYSQRTLHDIYEIHVYLDLKSFENDYDEEMDVAKPYIVTLDKETKEILRISRNWKKNDANFNKRKYFVAYQYFTGFDIWGLGMARMSGTNAIAVTNMLRQTIDAATYQNLPAGFIQKGTSKQQITDITLGAGQWKAIDTTNVDIRSALMQLPANGPSQGLMQLRQEIIGQMQEQLSTAELGMMQSKEDIPVGTAVAFLEENNKIQSSVLKSLHASFSEELRLLDDVFKEVIEREEFFVNGEEFIITKEHFVDSVQIVPVSDPSVNSTIQKIIRAEAVLQTAMQLPDKINILELLKMVFEAQGLSPEVIESLIMKQDEVKPLDPITENMNIMQEKPVSAGLEQNHDAHIAVHAMLDSPQTKAHIQEHMALKFFVQMQQAMNIDLSQIDITDQQIENEIAIKAAQAVESLGLNNQEEEENNELSPNALMAADIEQKREANIIKQEIAKDRVEVDIFKEQLHFEVQKLKLKAEKEKLIYDARLEIEKLKNRL